MLRGENHSVRKLNQHVVLPGDKEKEESRNTHGQADEKTVIGAFSRVAFNRLFKESLALTLS